MPDFHEDMVALIRSLQEARERLRLEIERTQALRAKYAQRAASLVKTSLVKKKVARSHFLRRPAQGPGC